MRAPAPGPPAPACPERQRCGPICRRPLRAAWCRHPRSAGRAAGGADAVQAAGASRAGCHRPPRPRRRPGPWGWVSLGLCVAFPQHRYVAANVGNHHRVHLPVVVHGFVQVAFFLVIALEVDTRIDAQGHAVGHGDALLVEFAPGAVGLDAVVADGHAVDTAPGIDVGSDLLHHRWRQRRGLQRLHRRPAVGVAARQAPGAVAAHPQHGPGVLHVALGLVFHGLRRQQGLERMGLGQAPTLEVGAPRHHMRSDHDGLRPGLVQHPGGGACRQHDAGGPQCRTATRGPCPQAGPRTRRRAHALAPAAGGAAGRPRCRLHWCSGNGDSLSPDGLAGAADAAARARRTLDSGERDRSSSGKRWCPGLAGGQLAASRRLGVLHTVFSAGPGVH